MDTSSMRKNYFYIVILSVAKNPVIVSESIIQILRRGVYPAEGGAPQNDLSFLLFGNLPLSKSNPVLSMTNVRFGAVPRVVKLAGCLFEYKIFYEK